MKWDGMRRNVEWDACDGMGWEVCKYHTEGQAGRMDGMGWDGTRWDGMGWEAVRIFNE